MKYIDNKENISSIYVTYKTVFFVVYWAVDNIFFTFFYKLIKDKDHTKKSYTIFKMKGRTFNEIP